MTYVDNNTRFRMGKSGVQEQKSLKCAWKMECSRIFLEYSIPSSILNGKGKSIEWSFQNAFQNYHSGMMVLGSSSRMAIPEHHSKHANFLWRVAIVPFQV